MSYIPVIKNKMYDLILTITFTNFTWGLYIRIKY